MHAVEQLIGVPCSHCLQTAVHWSIDFALYCGNIRVAQEVTAVDPVTSVSCEQAERTVTRATREIRMIILSALLLWLGFTHPPALARRRLSFPTTRSLFAGRPPLLPPLRFRKQLWI